MKLPPRQSRLPVGRLAVAFAMACFVPFAITTTDGRAAPASSVSATASAAPSAKASITVLATGRCHPDGVVVDATQVYFHENCDSRGIARVDRSGSAVPTLLAVRVGELAGMDGDDLLLNGIDTPVSTGVTAASLARLPKVGGVATPILAPTKDSLFTFAYDPSAWAFSTDDARNSEGALWITSRPAGKTLALGKGRFRAITLDATHVYTMEMDGTIAKFPREGGPKTVLHKVAGTGFFWRGDLVLDGDDVYHPGTGGVRKVKKSGGGSTLMIPIDSPERMSVSAEGTIYVLGAVDEVPSGDTIRGLFRAPKTGGKPKLVAKETRDAVAFALDGDFVIVALQEAGRIVRVPR